MANDDYSTEVWRDIPGFEGFYQASSAGRIRSVDRVIYRTDRWGNEGAPQHYKGKVLRQSATHGGYWRVGLSKDNKTRHRFVHGLICETFHGPRPPDYQVAHLNGIPSDSRADNLTWATQAENMQMKRAHGTMPCGTKARNAKLSDAAVRDMRARYHQGEKILALAREHGVDRGVARAAIRGTSWRHVS